MMELDIERLAAAVRDTWDTAQGTALVPAELELTHVVADIGSLTVHVTDATGVRFGMRIALPTERDRDHQTDDDTPEEWAQWNVLVPLVEELETDAASRFPPGVDGVRWITT